MKVQNIIPISIKVSNVNKNNFNLKSNSIPFDSVSFGAKELEMWQMIDLRRDADVIEKKAKHVYQNANSNIDDAYEKLAKAKKVYMRSLAYIGVVKKNPQKAQIKLSNGEKIGFKFEFEGKKLSLNLDIYNEHDEKIYSISADDFNPTRIVEYKPNQKGNIYQFNTNQVVISDNIYLEGENSGICDANYVFIDGELASVRTNVEHRSVPQTSDDFFII